LGRGFLYGGGEVFEAEEKLEERDCELADAHRRLKAAQKRAEAAENEAAILQRTQSRLRDSLEFYLMAGHGLKANSIETEVRGPDAQLALAVLSFLKQCEMFEMVEVASYENS
jgi:hypothetical protein